VWESGCGTVTKLRKGLVEKGQRGLDFAVDKKRQRMEIVRRPWLSFKLKETPEWKRVDETISSMIDDITKWRTEYENIKDSRQEFIGEFFQRVKQDYIDVTSMSEKKKSILPVRKANTGKAMEEFQEMHDDSEMKYTGLLTPQRISEIHKTLLKDLYTRRGCIRKVGTPAVYVIWGEKHYFPSPHEVNIEDLLRILIDCYNNLIAPHFAKTPPNEDTAEPPNEGTAEPPIEDSEESQFRDSAECNQQNVNNKNNNNNNKDSSEYTRFIFKCAAELMVRFVSLHPYGDGNGRMCRLLANYVVGLITPFPVSPYSNKENRSSEKDYIDAIHRWRKNEEEGPHDLAAMLVEDAWHRWREFNACWEEVWKKNLFGLLFCVIIVLLLVPVIL